MPVECTHLDWLCMIWWNFYRKIGNGIHKSQGLQSSWNEKLIEYCIFNANFNLLTCSRLVSLRRFSFEFLVLLSTRFSPVVANDAVLFHFLPSWEFRRFCLESFRAAEQPRYLRMTNARSIIPKHRRCIL